LRKARGLTQAQLGALLGVSQARVAEIEANPGLVNFEQLMKLLSVLGVTLTLHQEGSAPAKAAATRTKGTAKPASPPAHPKTTRAPSARKAAPTAPRASFVVRPKKGSW
jgi:HTH-type transcriptional regulator / antitoxin HipB